MLPFMAPEALQRLLLAVDAFVLVSKAEGFPLSLQEALVAGLPCLVTRVPGFEEHLREDDVVWVEPDAEAIRTALLALASDPRRRADLADRASAAGRREFSFDRFLDAYETLYAEAISSAARV